MASLISLNLPINTDLPTTLHVDENSCFASIEQQEKPHLRGKPVAIAAYTGASGCVVSPSIESKLQGVKVGMTVREARSLCPKIIILPPDPPKYRHVMEQLVGIYREYTPDVEMLSIDEAVLQLKGTPVLKRLGMEGIAREIRSKILERVGCWMKCSYGIGTNRFLAKTAAGLKKPDGLNTISHTNVIEVLSKLKLTDLCGIANKNQARLNSKGIFTPLEFLAAPVDVLEKMVFESIEGYYWHLRLRGIEIDDAPTTRGVFGNSYSLQRPTTDKREISRLALKLCEKAGRRMRQAGYSAQGVHVSCVYNRKDHWHEGKKFKSGLVTTDELHVKAQYLLNRQPWLGSVTNLAISCFSLEQSGSANQLTLFEDDFTKKRKLSVALDSINDKYGEYTIYKALMHGMDDQIIDRISFGGVKELVEQAFKQG